MGSLSYEVGRVKEAEEWFKKAVKISKVIRGKDNIFLIDDLA